MLFSPDELLLWPLVALPFSWWMNAWRTISTTSTVGCGDLNSLKQHVLLVMCQTFLRFGSWCGCVLDLVFLCVGQLLDFSLSSSRLLLVVREGLLLKMLIGGWDKQWVSHVWFLCSTVVEVLCCFVSCWFFPLHLGASHGCWKNLKPDGMLCSPFARITNFHVSHVLAELF